MLNCDLAAEGFGVIAIPHKTAHHEGYKQRRI